MMQDTGEPVRPPAALIPLCDGGPVIDGIPDPGLVPPWQVRTRHQPLEDTLTDTLNWELTRDPAQPRRAGLTDDDERSLLRAIRRWSPGPWPLAPG